MRIRYVGADERGAAVFMRVRYHNIRERFHTGV
jgi:hypothetical protein